jgi:hypothetical protein
MMGEPDLAAKTTSTKRTLKDMSEPLTNGQKDSPMNDANEGSQVFQVSLFYHYLSTDATNH